MSAGAIGLMVLAGVVLALVLTGAAVYNGLVGLRNQVRNAWSQIDVQLKRRHDLIPNLVETARGYMQHERETFTAITEARARAAGARSVKEAGQAETRLSQALSAFNMVVENYPELKANTNFLSLQEELTSTENRIAFARQAYNDQVLFLNNKVEMFPSNLVANLFAFRQEEYFEMEDLSERQAPQVRF